MTYKQIVKSLEVRQRELARTRDKLRELQYEVEEQLENINGASESLDFCIEELSKLV